MRKFSTSIVEYCLRSSSWLEWIKLLTIAWNWSLSPIIFSMSLPNVFRKMMGLNILRGSYDALLNFGMIMDNNFLKYFGQWPSDTHMLVILTRLLRHFLSLILTKLLCKIIDLGISWIELRSTNCQHLKPSNTMKDHILICIAYSKPFIKLSTLHETDRLILMFSKKFLQNPPSYGLCSLRKSSKVLLENATTHQYQVQTKSYGNTWKQLLKSYCQRKFFWLF